MHAATTLREVSRDAPGARVRVALSGGSTPAVLFELIAAKFRRAIPWARLEVFFGDERAVPPDHADSNYGLAERLLLSRVEIPRPQIHRMHADAPDLDAAARAYEAEIRGVVPCGGRGVPAFDLIWLGVGTDGHTASLFPGSKALEETERLALPARAPDGSQRMTLTLPLLRGARLVQFLATGTSKAAVVGEILEESADGSAGSPYPAARVVPDGELEWVLDDEAASELQRDLLA